MTRPADPRQHFRHQCLTALVAGAALVVAAGLWACLPLGDPPALVLAEDPPAQATPVEPAAASSSGPWEVTLWQPLADQPVAPPPPPPPPPVLTLKLFSVFKRGGIQVAAIDPGDGTPLQYAKAGDHLLGVEIVEVDARGVTLLNATQRQRLELAR